VPDLITFAKGVNSGYVPAGGVILPQAVAAEFDTRVFPGGLTYSGHPLAMASIVASIDAMRDEGIIEHAAHLGADVLGPGLRELAGRHPVVGEVRGLGVFWALELVADRDTREPLPAADMATIKHGLMAAGLLPFLQDNRIHVVPPCIMTEDEARRGLAILDAVLP
jgi:taurine--2-oxoglutarate transaminase